MINIIHIDTPFVPTICTPHGDGLWQIDLSGVETYECPDAVGKYTGLLQITPTVIGHIRIGMLYYDLVSSIPECRNNPRTFFYDNTIFRIYINVCDSSGLIGFQAPWGQRLEIGIINYFIDRVDYSRAEGAYYNDNYHCPIVSSISDRNEKRDRVFYDNISYTTVDIEMLNYDGAWDGKLLANRVARHYTLEDGEEFSEAVLQQYGIVSKPNVSNTKLTFTIDDFRKSLETNIDLGRINTGTYPYYDDDPTDDEEPEDKIFPIAIGQIKGYEPTCLDKGNTASDTAAYALCKAYGGYSMDSVSDVWIQLTDENSIQYDLVLARAGQIISYPSPLSKDSLYADVYPDGTYTIDFAAGTISVPRGFAREASVNDGEVSYDWRDVRVNFTGWCNRKAGEPTDLCGVDLIKIGLSVFGGTDYEAWNFDLTTFAIERVKSIEMTRAGLVVSCMIDSDKTITEFLKDVCQAFHITYKLRGDNRYTCKVYDTEAAGDVKYTIRPEHLFDRTDNHAQDTSEVMSICKVSYGFAGNDDNKKSLTDDSMKNDIEQNMHVTKTADFETILATKEAAQLKATALLKASLNPPTATTFKLWMNSENVSLSVSDTIAAPRDRNGDIGVYNITQVVKSYKNNTVTITANKIADVRYTGYIQGHCFRSQCYGTKAYSITAYTED